MTTETMIRGLSKDRNARTLWQTVIWPALRKIGTAQCMRTDSSTIGRRAAMHDAAHAVANARGFFLMIECGRDCDMQTYSHVSAHNIACMRDVERRIDDCYSWAEGPVSVSFEACTDEDMRKLRKRVRFARFFV